VLTRLAGVRTLLRKRVHSDWAAIEAELHHIEEEFRLYLEGDWHCSCHHGQPHPRPATITVTASQEGHTMSSYTAGTPVDLVADVKDDQQNEVPSDQVVWSSDQGTVTSDPADPSNPLKAQLVNAPVGTATVTATTSNGIASTDAVEFTDPNAGVPASITISDSAAPAAPAAAPSA
jgi:hypothetical protein